MGLGSDGVLGYWFSFSMLGPPPGGNGMDLEAIPFSFFKRQADELPSLIRDMLVFGVHGPEGNAMLEKSLFCYRYGKDPTLIVA